MPVNAVDNYQTADAAVGALLLIESSYADPPPVADRPSVEGLRGAAAVLMVAGFENYLREAIVSGLESINHSTPPCKYSRLPRDLQITNIYATLEVAMKPRYDAASTQKIQRLPGIIQAASRVQNGYIDGTAIADTGGNPNSEIVKRLFKSIGVPNVFDKVKRKFDASWGSPTALTFLPDTLDGIVRRRHTVAHTASALAISRTDLANGRRFLDCLVKVLDGTLDRHVAAVIAAAQ